MDDPTHKSLAAALLDQKIAGAFAGRRYAYAAVLRDGPLAWGIGIAVKEEPGYHPIESDDFAWDDFDAAENFADGMNRHIGLTSKEAITIVASTMARI